MSCHASCHASRLASRHITHHREQYIICPIMHYITCHIMRHTSHNASHHVTCHHIMSCSIPHITCNTMCHVTHYIMSQVTGERSQGTGHRSRGTGHGHGHGHGHLLLTDNYSPLREQGTKKDSLLGQTIPPPEPLTIFRIPGFFLLTLYYPLKRKLCLSSLDINGGTHCDLFKGSTILYLRRNQTSRNTVINVGGKQSFLTFSFFFFV